jgi:hypothetical protein
MYLASYYQIPLLSPGVGVSGKFYRQPLSYNVFPAQAKRLNNFLLACEFPANIYRLPDFIGRITIAILFSLFHSRFQVNHFCRPPSPVPVRAPTFPKDMHGEFQKIRPEVGPACPAYRPFIHGVLPPPIFTIGIK